MSQSLTEKRSLEEIDSNLLNLAAQQASEDVEHANKRRRRQYKPMTQYTQDTQTSTSDNTLQNSSCPSGYIKKIVLRNFMSHEHFEMEFGPRLNFIVGNNGSGKSAILTAITVGLGSKASETNRGNSLKDLIRNGTPSSKITITLDNSSEKGSYQPEIFGKEIIIERVIKRDGPATFTLKTESGKEISRKKKDIQAITEYFAIPISNPMCFLSQDTARSFLSSSTPQDKYLYFVRGTLLEEIKNNLDEAKNIVDAANENMALHSESLVQLRQQYENAKKLVRELDQTGTLNGQKRLLQGKQLWIVIEQNKRAVQKELENIKGYQTKLGELDHALKAKASKIEKYKSDIETNSQTIETLNDERKEKDQKHQQARDELRNIRKKYEATKENIKEAKEKTEQCQRKVANLDRSIASIKVELQRRMGINKEQMRQELEDLSKEKEELIERTENLKSKLEDSENKERNMSVNRDTEIASLNSSLQRNQLRLRKIKEGDSTFISNFHRNMDRLLSEISRNKNKFHSIPIGPLGKFVTVKETSRDWAPAIQKYLSSSLSSLVVMNDHDNKLLKQLFQSCGMKGFPIIQINKLENFDYSSGRANTEHPTITDVLDFTKPEYGCLLVNLHRIEQVVLIKNHNTARTFLLSNPNNVKMALSQKNNAYGFQLSRGTRLDTVPYDQTLKLKIGNVSDNGVAYIQGQIDETKIQIQRVRDEHDASIRLFRSELPRIRDQIKDCNNTININNRKISHLRIELEKTEDTGVLMSKEHEKEKLEQAIIGYEGAINVLNTELDGHKQNATQIKEIFEQTRSEFDKVVQAIDQLKEKIEKNKKKIAKYNEDISMSEQRKRTYDASINETEENIKRLNDGIKGQEEYANKYASFEEISQHNLPDNKEEIDKELKEISRKISTAEKQIGMTQEETLKNFENTRKEYKEGNVKYRAIMDALVGLNDSIERRTHNYQATFRSTCIEADMEFRMSLRIRDFTGNLLFNESEKSLEMHVLTSNDKNARAVDTLSGGEKSYSQISLLLATWEPMRSRIIGLDEFDVYMDQVNRKIGTNLLVKKLKDQMKTQTIIITPQDIGKMADIDSTGVNIHRIKDPERHNNSENQGVE